MNSVVHFEMPFDDQDRMTKFYESAFGWHTQKLGEDMGSYVLATTIETNDNGPRKLGAINGGFFPKTRLARAAYGHCNRGARHQGIGPESNVGRR